MNTKVTQVFYKGYLSMEVKSTTERDWLIEAQGLVKKLIWHIKKDKKYDKENPNWRNKKF